MSETQLWVFAGAVLSGTFIIMILKLIYVFRAGFASCVTGLISLIGAVIAKEFIPSIQGEGSISVGKYLAAEGQVLPIETALTNEIIFIFVFGALAGMIISTIGILGLDARR